jgi:asparagine synthase (glutamine-hydrolysing)
LINDIYGGPFADSAALPTYYISKLARKDVKVLLSGDGADELFFGYRNHKSMLFESRLRKSLPDSFTQKVLPWIAEKYPNNPSIPRVFRAQSTLRSLSKTLSYSYCQAMSITSRKILESLYSDSFKSELQGFRTEDDFAIVASKIEHEDPMKVIQHIDFNTYLPGSVLTKTDRATMMCGVEARLPFLSNDLVDRVLPIDTNHNLGWKKDKAMLRQWSTSILSKKISFRDKRSFTSPFDKWFRALPLVELHSIILTDSLLDRNIFKKESLIKLMSDHYRGNADHGITLLSIALLAESLGQDGIVFNKDRYENFISPPNCI